MARTSTVLSGHALAKEGAPFERTVDRYAPVRPGWTGVALCSCGEASEVLKSNRARKNWHRQHKDQIREENSRD